MPALRVFVDNSHILTVSSDGLDLVDVRVSATKVESDLAALEVHGGSYSKPGESRFLFWLDHRPLQAGQRVSVEFSQEGQSSWAGKTVDELYPDAETEPNEPEGPLLSRDQMLDQLALRPKEHDRLSCTVSLPNATIATATESSEHGYAFGVSWHSHRPDRARVSLHSYSIESMRRNENGTYHVQESLNYGEAVSLDVGA